MSIYNRQNGERRRTPRRYMFICCDCGLAHVYQFDVMKNGHIYTQVWRDSKTTRQQRRTKRYAGLKLPSIQERGKE